MMLFNTNSTRSLEALDIPETGLEEGADKACEATPSSANIRQIVT